MTDINYSQSRVHKQIGSFIDDPYFLLTAFTDMFLAQDHQS